MNKEHFFECERLGFLKEIVYDLNLKMTMEVERLMVLIGETILERDDHRNQDGGHNERDIRDVFKRTGLVTSRDVEAFAGVRDFFCLGSLGVGGVEFSSVISNK